MSKTLNYLYCFTVIMASGNPALRLFDLNAITIGLFLIGALFFVRRMLVVTVRGALTITAIGFLLLIQVVLFGDLVIPASIGFFLNILIGFMLMSSMPNFLQYFVRCMFAISIVSIAMYFLVYLPGNADLFRDYSVYEESIYIRQFHIGFYNFRGYTADVVRNSGPFWEPGAFAGYLAFALYIMALQSSNKRQSPIIALTLIVALLTTLSTMGYIAFLLVLFSFLFKKFEGARLGVLVFVFPLILGGTVYAAFQAAERIPFLKEKVVQQIDSAEEGANNAEINRIGNVEYDWGFIQLRPLFGWSANVETRYVIDIGAAAAIQAQGNALTGLAARFGIVGWLIFMTSFFLSFHRMSGSFILGCLGFSLIAITFTGEKYMNYPLIMTFLFCERHHIHKRSLKVKRRKASGDTTLGAKMRSGKRLILSPFGK